jgi:nitroreductase
MTDTALLDALKTRNSAPRLCAPAPDDAQLNEMLRCALRSPDHAWLRPWRFVSVRGEQRDKLGELMEASLLRREPGAEQAARDKARNAPLRAPLLIVVLAAVTEHPKVPAWEQHISAGCAAFSLLLAAEGLGFGGVWRTGATAEDPQFARDIGAADNEKIVGFLYIGTRDGMEKTLPTLDPGDFHREWTGNA